MPGCLAVVVVVVQLGDHQALQRGTDLHWAASGLTGALCQLLSWQLFAVRDCTFLSKVGRTLGPSK